MKTNDYVQSTLKTTLDQNKFKVFFPQKTLWKFWFLSDASKLFQIITVALKKQFIRLNGFFYGGHLSSNLCFLSAKNVGRRIRTQKVQSYRVWTIFLKLRTSFYRYNKDNFLKYEKVRKLNSFDIFVYTYR